MTSRAAFKRELKKIDRSTRLCLLHLERTIDEKFKLALKVKTPPIPKVDFSKLESQIDSLQKQITGLRKKIDSANSLVKKFDEHEVFLKSLTNKVEKFLDELKEHFNDLYNAGYYSEGTKRKIRDAGLIHE